MRTAAARNGRAYERSAHKVAERLAKRAGLDVEDWIDEAVAAYADELGVEPRDLSERERMEAIEERVARAEEGRPGRESARFAERDDQPPRRPASRRDLDDAPRRGERSRLEDAIARIEQRAVRAESRSARVSDVREDERGRLEAAIEDIERRAERNEERTARALESLTGLVEVNGSGRAQLDEVVGEIEKRAARSEKRMTQALESLAGLVEASGGERDVLKDAIAKVEARTERNAERTAKALESLTGLIDARKGERDRLEAAIERVGKRAEETEARTARALDSLTNLVKPASPAPAAPRHDAVAARLDALARRAAHAPETAPAPGEDDEAFRLVSERLARRRKTRPEAEAVEFHPAPQPDPFAGMREELRRLGEKFDSLPQPAAQAPDKAATVERMERQVVQLAQLVERLVTASPAPAELAQAVKALADVRAEIDRLAPGPAIQALDRRVEDLGRRIETAAQRPFDDLARRIETLRDALERQAARPGAETLIANTQALAEKIDRAAHSGAQSVAALGQLQAMVARLEAAAQRPAPFDDLARRIDGVREALTKQSARPDADALIANTQALAEKIDRAAHTGTQSAAALSQLQAMVARLEAAAQRPAPFDDLARRIESVRGAVERQGAAVGELSAKVDRPAAASVEIERLEQALRLLARQVEAALSRSAAIDLKPVEDLARRIESVRDAVAAQGVPSGQVERLENQLAALVARLDHPVENPQIEAVGASLRKLATRVDEVAARPAFVAGESFAPHAARLEAALGQLSAKVDEAASRPATVSLDPRPIEDLARRIESVRESLENPPTFAPHVERLESVLGKVAEKLDQAGPVIDANGINSTLAAMNARLEEAFRRPAVAQALDRAPIDALAARLEAMRESVERQAGQFDVGRIAEAVRGAVQTMERPGFGAENTVALTAAIERLATRLDSGVSGFDAAHIEDLLRQALGKLDRPAVNPAHLDALADAVAELAEKVETPASESRRVAALLERVEAHLAKPADAPADLSALIDVVSSLAAHGAPAPDVRRLEDKLADIAARLERPGADGGDVSTLAESIAELGHKIDRSGGARGLQMLEDLTRDIAIRLDEIENGLADRALDAQARPSGSPELERAVREMGGRIAELRAVVDTRGVEQEIRTLQSRIEEIADVRMSSAFVEQAAKALARDVGERVAAATPDALIDIVRDIHDRLDVLASPRAAPALEGALRELGEEIASLRETRGHADRSAATLTDLRAEQAQIDRRMDARFTGVQDILEKLVDRLGRLEREIVAEGPRAAQAPAMAPAPAPARAPAAARAALHDIPDRAPGENRAPAPLAETEPLTAAIAAQGRAREGAEGAAGKAAALSAHIAAARRAASAAAADMERREEAARDAKDANGVAALGQRAQALFNQHRRPVLLGAAGLMTILTGAAVLEMRSGHTPVRKSELEAPAAQSQPLAGEPSVPNALDKKPTGAIAPEPRVIAAPLPPPKAEAAPKAAAKPTAALIGALPQTLSPALTAASANGDLGAEIEIAQRFLEGRTVPRDPKVAAEWLQTAADAGSPFAQYRLAALYEKGVGVSRDIEKARALYRKSADAGNARAMHNLAVLYAQDGGNGKPDYTAAMDWFKKASDYGVRDSQFNLGVLYGRGLGSGQDLAQSWTWFSLAAKQGDADAGRKRDEVAARMDGRLMTAAKKAFDDYKAKTPDPAVNDAPPLPAAATAESPAGDAPKAATSVKG